MASPNDREFIAIQLEKRIGNIHRTNAPQSKDSGIRSRQMYALIDLLLDLKIINPRDIEGYGPYVEKYKSFENPEVPREGQ